MDIPTVKEYLRAVVMGDWPAILSGGLSVPFTCAALFMSNAYPRKFFGLLAVTGAFIAGYRKWAKERGEHLKTQSELENEIAKQGRPQVTVELKNDGWGRLSLCLMNYTDSPAVNLRADDIQCGRQTLRLDLPTLVSSGFRQHTQVYCPDQVGESRNFVAKECILNRKKGTEVSETMLAALRYTDQEARHEWVTFCEFTYNFSTKKFVIQKQWIESSQPAAPEHLPRPILTAP